VTFWQTLPLVLWGIPLLVLVFLVVEHACIEIGRRRWTRHANQLLERVEQRQAERIAEDILSDAELISSVQLQWLEDCWALPDAPGSF
jgi:hypothetical protein